MTLSGKHKNSKSRKKAANKPHSQSQMAALRNIIQEEIARKEKKGGPKPLSAPANSEKIVESPLQQIQLPQEMEQLIPPPPEAIEHPVETLKTANPPVNIPKINEIKMTPLEKTKEPEKSVLKTEVKKEKKTKSFFSQISFNLPEMENMSQQIMNIAIRSQKIINSFLERNKITAESLSSKDSAHLKEAFADFMKHLASEPDRFIEANLAFWQDYVKLLQNTVSRAQGKEIAPIISPEPGDKRFKDDEWQTNWVFDYIKESYLLSARWAHGLTENVKGLDPQIHHKVDFYTRQIVDAMAPTNFWLMNPEVLRTTIESKGENLIKGLQNMLADIEEGHGKLRISMSDNSAFTLGENIATTKGKVVFQNHLFQLIQYSPLTETVNETPMLIVPPWINKYYIMDLKEKNSMVRYLVEQGNTVFIISWVNPDEKLAKIGFEDYMMDGTLAAATEVARITGEKAINCSAFCIGGTLLATTLSWLASAGDKKPAGVPEIKSATYFATLIDFSQPGDIGVFIDEDQIQMIEDTMKEKGYLPGSNLAMSFSMLRANNLIWSFVINNYLMGKEPFPFDMLTWNSDSTNLTEAMQSFYLRNMYLENNLIKPNKLSMKDVPIDLRKIKVPSFCVSSIEDHISLWRANYIATQTYSGPVTFCLAGSGHIAGIINPPAKEKYNYWTNPECPTNPDEWYRGAENHKGSWWPEWMKWLSAHTGGKVPARDPANGNVIEDAPGSYVRVKGS